MKGINFAIILALVVSIGIFLVYSSNQPDPSDPPAPVDPDHPIPAKFKFHTPVSPDTTFMCDVIMSSVVPSNTTIQLYCTKKTLVTAANKDTFPASLTIPKGDNHAVVMLHTGKAANGTSIMITAGQPGADMSHTDNWQASQELIIETPSRKHNKRHRQETAESHRTLAQ